MPSGEKIGNSDNTNAGEMSGNTLRQTYEQRGELTLEAIHAHEAEVENLEELYNIYDKMGALSDEEKTELKNNIERLKQLNSQEQEIFSNDNKNQQPSDSTPETDASNKELTNESAEKAKAKRGFRRFIVGVGVSAAIVVIASIGANIIKNSRQGNEQDSTRTEQAEQDQDTTEDKESIAELSTYRGQFANEDGTSYNSEKGAKVNFGEELKSDAPEAEMKDEMLGRMIQPGQLAATYFYMQEKTSNPDFGVEGAKFSNPDDLLEAMENDSELHQKVYNYIKDTIINNSLAESTVTGTFHNFFMDSQFETGNIDTSNVEVVGCTTNEDGTKVYSLAYTWEDKDGNFHMDTFTFKEKCGGQPLDQLDFTTTVRQIPSPENPDNPDDPHDDLKPKDYDNMTRIDNQILEDIADDIGTEEVRVTPTPTEDVSRQTPTQKPSSESYQGTEATTVVNNSASEATPAPAPSNPQNNYNENRGGANSDQYAPVQDNQSAQKAADQAEIPISEAPTDGQELEDSLSDLGIN